MFNRLLKAWADNSLRAEFDAERAAHEATRRLLAIAQAEIDSLAAVVARDRERVAAEAACFARKRAEAEGMGSHEQRN